jgi:OPA family glycerol-3-phosphate transporter-like MFS transporter
MNLFSLLWLVYFASNLGRMSYAACMVEIINREGFSAASAGLVGTGFFICYGIGQIGSGYIGGRGDPFKLIFTGLFCTALANLAMGFAHTAAFMFVIWCCNGLIQSILWPPILRIIVGHFTEPYRSKVCVNISTTYPAAVMFAYLSCAGIITVLPWRAVFFFYSAALFIVSGIWVIYFGKIARPELFERINAPKENQGPVKQPYRFFTGKNAPGIAIVFFCLALVSQGALKDGLTAWIPAYITKVFSLPASMAILSAGILPLINLGGIYLCRLLYNRIKDEGKISVYLFGASFLAALVLRFAGERHLLFSLSGFAVITACMMGVNLMLVTFVPAGFSKFGLVSFLTGLTNSMVYLGSSVSNFGIALIVEKAGWNGLLGLLPVLALVSAGFCALASPGWAAFAEMVHQRYKT